MRTLLLLVFFCASQLAGAQVKVYVHRDSSVHGSLSGTLYLYTTTDTAKGVPDEPDIRNPQPMYKLPLGHWSGSAPQVFDDRAAAFSEKLSQLPPGVYALAAVADVHPEQWSNRNKGNYYTRKKVLLTVNDQHKGEAHLYLDGQIRPEFRENDSIRLLELHSALLSRFHRKDIRMEAAVYLPRGFEPASAQTYPVVYIIPGWGGTHLDAMTDEPRKRYGIGNGLPKIYVLLNPETQTPYGLHAFVDSRVNGPWGRALVEEMIPYIRRNYKGSTDPQQTFVMGQSSGGYPSLWLPLHYPRAFGGGWAVSPDPVDFSDFIGVHLYAPQANFYTDSSGQPIPFFFWKGKYMNSLRTVQAIEDFQDMGGQTQSFEAEFGLPDKRGRPMPLFNRATGALYPEAVRAWRDYDLGLYIQAHWKALARDLSGGKLHVYAGSEDNFGLNRAVLALAEKVRSTGADIVTEVVPGANHWSIWRPPFTARIQGEMEALIKKAKEARQDY